MNTNYLPVINDMTIFSSNRVHIIPFDRHFEEWEQDKTLKSEFATDGAKSAILNWLIEGFQLLQKEGFKPPKSVIDATAAYSHDSDKIAQFAEDKLVEDAGAEVRTSVVYDHYKLKPTLSQKNLSSAVKAVCITGNRKLHAKNFLRTFL